MSDPPSPQADATPQWPTRKTSPHSTPKVIGLSGHARAAYALSDRALRFLPSVIAGLLLIFLIVEWRQQQAIGALQDAAIAAARAPQTTAGGSRLDRLLHELDDAATHSVADPPALRQALEQAAADLTQDPDQKQTLQDCAAAVEAPPEARFRRVALAACQSVLRSLRASAADGCGGCVLSQLAVLTRQAKEARTAFRSSWLLVAQLILLNLMLPLLTGLFGYLFGRQSVTGGEPAGDGSGSDD